MKIDLTDGQVYSVVVREIKSHRNFLKREIRVLSGKKNAKSYEKDDLARFREVAKAMDIIVSYYDS